MGLAIKNAISDKGITISRKNTLPIVKKCFFLFVSAITISPLTFVIFVVNLNNY
jgi:hypothetical protein